ncbi:SEC-C motif-containing protein [Streptomyces sp. TLI_235]|nr:YchJ family metal-binding protein [Streptomyces sp. TLI_235]PBC70860.1 SEC-C motif-containing protein [Streptomyces sp. TLI_235]
MGRMSKRRRHPRFSPTDPCPCGLGGPYGGCCGRLHRGETTAGTAEQLMRSRYSAFAVQDGPYLLRSWHPDTRPPRIDFDPGLHWTGLEILGTTEGGPFHTEGTVRFRAHFTDEGEPGAMEEHSSFVRVDGAWVYVAALPED